MKLKIISEKSYNLKADYLQLSAICDIICIGKWIYISLKGVNSFGLPLLLVIEEL